MIKLRIAMLMKSLCLIVLSFSSLILYSQDSSRHLQFFEGYIVEFVSQRDSSELTTSIDYFFTFSKPDTTELISPLTFLNEPEVSIFSLGYYSSSNLQRVIEGNFEPFFLKNHEEYIRNNFSVNIYRVFLAGYIEEQSIGKTVQKERTSHSNSFFSNVEHNNLTVNVLLSELVIVW